MKNQDMKENRFLRWSKSKKKLNAIKKILNDNRNVYICTQLKITKITPKTFKSWEKEGGFFKASKSGLYMRQGKKFVCIDYCVIKFDI